MKTEKEARELIAIAIGQASMCWECPAESGVFLSHQANKIIDELVIDLELQELPDSEDKINDDLTEEAWGIIANAYGGDWELASSEWKTAAERWRDQYRA